MRASVGGTKSPAMKFFDSDCMISVENLSALPNAEEKRYCVSSQIFVLQSIFEEENCVSFEKAAKSAKELCSDNGTLFQEVCLSSHRFLVLALIPPYTLPFVWYQTARPCLVPFFQMSTSALDSFRYSNVFPVSTQIISPFLIWWPLLITG